MSNRQQVIMTLKDFAGPLGPFETIEEQDERKAAWVEVADWQIVEDLLQVLAFPPKEDEIYPITKENFEIELVELLISLGKRDSSGFLKRLEPYLSNTQARPALIEVIGGLGLKEGISLLQIVLIDRSLSEDEIIRIACALGEIGGSEARSLLEQMRTSVPRTMTALQQEIDIAIQDSH